jgi:hypothetical protein
MKSRDFSFARIRINKTQDESFELIKKILDEVKLTNAWKEKIINEEKHFIFCKPKIFNFTLRPNKVIADIFIFSKPEGNNSVIDIYYNTMTITGTAQTNNVIDPIYNKLCQVMSNTLPIFLNMVKMTDEELEESANESIRSDNSTQNANSVADEIAKLAKLKESGALTDDEFTKMKNDLIEKM